MWYRLGSNGLDIQVPSVLSIGGRLYRPQTTPDRQEHQSHRVRVAVDWETARRLMRDMAVVVIRGR